MPPGFPSFPACIRLDRRGVPVHFQEKSMFQPTRLKPLFHPGKLLITPAAFAALRTNGVPVISVMLRHLAGDWGSVSDNDKEQNDLSIATGLRLLSIYRLPDGNRIIVTTEWDRSSTTVERFDEVVTGQKARSTSTTRRSYPAWPIAQYVQEAHS
jgi:hypothetical protein